ncbi:hypothetical protein MJH54_31810, partial [Salmonella enterica subsp. enterica serovar Montevideo]|nr:hypothetical protein [Salmonella enterica subsp. enterica serovar Montevideo]
HDRDQVPLTDSADEYRHTPRIYHDKKRGRLAPFSSVKPLQPHLMPYPNPADIARMKEDKNINLMEQAGLNVGYLSYNVQKKPLD